MVSRVYCPMASRAEDSSTQLLITVLTLPPPGAEVLYAAAIVNASLETGASRRNHGPTGRPPITGFTWPSRRHTPSRADAIVAVHSVPDALIFTRPTTHTDANTEAMVTEARSGACQVQGAL